MTLIEKIKAIYPDLDSADFNMDTGTIHLQNDGDGDYIAQWDHPALTKPTPEQLVA